ncbi:unnamed protein product [Brachionus calyciflorus]|uniref:Uncharacterized protein n=1 Tax=Brachionus calyciflorus TaxID=104777 RepID=A0A814NP06_9BILA|nr:unnamed protein product [Brachionus calyciflorus]
MIQQHESYYTYAPNTTPPLQLIGSDPKQNNSNPATQLPQASPLTNSSKNSRLINSRPVKRLNSTEEDDDELLCSQEKLLNKTPKTK